MTNHRLTVVSLAVLAGSALAGVAQAQLQPAPEPLGSALLRRVRPVQVTLPAGTVPVVNPQTGLAEDHTVTTRWRPICGSDTTRIDEADLRRIIAINDEQFAPGAPIRVVDTPRGVPATRATGLNVVFNMSASVPDTADAAFAIAEQYLEGKFTDNITISINVGWQSMGSGVIGATGSNFVNNVAYSTTRTRLVANATSGTDIQNFLPTGSTLPVRFTGTTTAVTNVSAIDWTIANARAAGVTASGGVVAQMTYNSDFSFDFNPANGVPGSQLSLVDTIVHEVGHAMGFVSAADNQGTEVETMDLYRFQRTNTGGTWNPTNTTTFQSLPRLVDFNAPNDDHIVDFGGLEYRMSDGSPWQASHFLEQFTPIGIMDPALSGGQTFHPNFLRTSDVAVFKAMGWNDNPPCATTIDDQPSPSSLSLIAGQALNLSVEASTNGGGEITYQWRRNTGNLSDMNPRFSGSTSANLTVDPLLTSDVGAYSVVVTSSCGVVTSSLVNVTIAARCPADRDDGTGTGHPNGAIEIDDLLYFLLKFEEGDAEVDLDNGAGFGLPDGAVNVDDLLFFLARFEAGC